MPPRHSDFSVAVLPFLKTTDDLSVGQVTFRSTDNLDGLPPERADHLVAIRNMLYLPDDLRLRSASYAIIPFIDLTRRPSDTEHLEDVQAVIAYCYASPRHEFGDLFLSSKHASLAIFTPGPVLLDLVRPSFHVIAAGPNLELHANERSEVDGYSGLYNFRHPFWAAPGSRLYGPTPRVSLNHVQNLAHDINQATIARVDYELLVRLLGKPASEVSRRVFTAIRWFNAANDAAMDDASAIVNLSIAFEALLGLPSSDKTERLVDAVSLLLGRIPRLNSWTQQFYDVRSQIVHEGRAAQVRFVAGESRGKPNVVGPLYQSLLSYGRQIFQVCVGTLLSGAKLAEQMAIESSLVTNRERFERMCKVLDDETVDTGARLDAIVPLIAAAERYQYVAESDLRVEEIVGAALRAARVLMQHNGTLAADLKSQLADFVDAQRTSDHLAQLEKLEVLEGSFSNR